MYENLKTGDKVYVREGGFGAGTHVETVTDFTKILIITDRGKYLKSSGIKYGHSSLWWPSCLKGKVETQ